MTCLWRVVGRHSWIAGRLPVVIKNPLQPHFRPRIAVPFTAVQVALDLSDLSTFNPSLSVFDPHLANDAAHALHHGYACSEGTSASLRPKLCMFWFWLIQGQGPK